MAGSPLGRPGLVVGGWVGIRRVAVARGEGGAEFVCINRRRVACETF